MHPDAGKNAPAQQFGKERKTVDMSISNISTGDRKAFYEQLTADNAAVLLVDHQVGLFTGVVDIDVLTLKHNVVAFPNPPSALGEPLLLPATPPYLTYA